MKRKVQVAETCLSHNNNFTTEANTITNPPNETRFGKTKECMKFDPVAGVLNPLKQSFIRRQKN